MVASSEFPRLLSIRKVLARWSQLPIASDLRYSCTEKCAMRSHRLCLRSPWSTTAASMKLGQSDRISAAPGSRLSGSNTALSCISTATARPNSSTDTGCSAQQRMVKTRLACSIRDFGMLASTRSYVSLNDDGRVSKASFNCFGDVRQFSSALSWHSTQRKLCSGPS